MFILYDVVDNRTKYYQAVNGSRLVLGAKRTAARFDKPMADKVAGHIKALFGRDMTIIDEGQSLR